MGFSKQLRTESRRIQTDLEQNLKDLTIALDSGADVCEELKSVKRELGDIELTKARETMFRARANWSQMGEHPTKYFLNLEKRNYVNKRISQLEDNDGQMVTSTALFVQCPACCVRCFGSGFLFFIFVMLLFSVPIPFSCVLFVLCLFSCLFFNRAFS